MASAEQQLLDIFSRIREVLSNQIRLQLTALGVECVNKARDRGVEESWRDRTGNLRSSIGFAYYEDGRKIVESAFQAVSGGSQGSREGKKMVEDLASEMTDAYCMVIVAAMDYADIVETKRDVLASAELHARSKIQSCVQAAIEDTIYIINNEL